MFFSYLTFNLFCKKVDQKTAGGKPCSPKNLSKSTILTLKETLEIRRISEHKHKVFVSYVSGTAKS